jgi:CzcA family heavy metal efflux pump
MLKKVIQFSIDQPWLVLLCAVGLLGAAGYRLKSIPVDVFPELNAPTVVVMTESPGLAADEVEQYVTFPLETAVNGIPGLRRVRSASAIGLSILYVEFDWGTDIYRARQMVSERLDSVREELPEDAHAEMTPITSITGEIMLLALSSPDGKASPMALREYAEFDLRTKLLAVTGVSQVSVIGGDLPEYQVELKQDTLRSYNLTFDDVLAATGASHSTLSAGYLPDVESLELPLRQTGRVRSVEDVRGTVVSYRDGRAITIGEIATVQKGASLKRGTGADGGKAAVVLSVLKAPDTNTLEVTNRVDQMLDALAPSMPTGMAINRQIFRQSDFINTSLENVVHALRDAAIIVSIIILLFLMNVRSTIVTLTALPLSLAAGLLVLEWLGMTINVMTLGGFAIAVGSLVDDAIIDVENVYRRFRQNHALPKKDRTPMPQVVFNASNEIRPAMVFATLIITLVFLPLMFLHGIEGRFFMPLGVAFVVSIAASLMVALTVTPALCRLLFTRLRAGAEKENAVVRGLKAVYRPAVCLALRLRWSVLALAAVATAASLWLGSTYGTSFLPEFKEGTFTVALFAPPGTSLAASDRLARSVERQVLEVEGVRSVTRRTGRAERDEHAEPVSNSEIDVTVKPGYSVNEVRDRMTSIVEAIPGITTNIGQPIQHRLSHVLSGTPAAIAINVYGEDLAVLREIAKEVETELKNLPGTRDVAANREVMIQSLPIRYNLRALADHGITPRSAAEQVRNAVYGVTAAEINDGLRRYRLRVMLAEDERDEISDVRNLILHGVSGGMVRLSEVADIGLEMNSNLIARENAQRKAVISLNVRDGYNLGHLIESVRKRVDPIVESRGYTVHYGGQFEAQQSASQTILAFSGLALLIMFVLLNVAVGSARVTVLVLVNLPLALIGGIIAIFVTESPSVPHNLWALFGHGTYVAPVISIASLVGFITLFGIAVRNGILLVNHYDYLQREEGMSVADAIVNGSMERLVPILMTALTAALALVPIILKGDQPGNEILAPLSVVILGGLLSSTFLNLIVVPAGYAIIKHAEQSSNPKPKETEA